MKPDPTTSKAKKWIERVEPWHWLAGSIIAVVLGIYGVIAFVRSEAQNAVLNEKFLATLAARVRPSCIFDSRGAIEADLGAGDYVEDIQVIPVPQIFGFEIVIKTKRHLAYAPLVTGIDVNLFPQTLTRRKLHDWSIVLSPQSTTTSIITEDPMNTNRVHRFRLEILH